MGALKIVSPGGILPRDMDQRQWSTFLNQAQAKYYRDGQTDYDTGTGFWIGNDGGTPKLSIGNSAGNKVTWDGSTLTIVGSLTATTGSFTGSVTIGTGGSLSSGQTAYDTGTGFWLEYNAGTPRISVGNSAGNKVTWDGTTLTVVGSVSGTIDATDLSGLVPLASQNLATLGWTMTNVFSSSDSDTVAWGSGTLTTADGTAYSIGAGNTGNMAARTFIYLDIGASTTAFQTTTTAANAVGSGKLLVAVAENTTTEAFFQVFGGRGGTLLTANEIAANSITANELNVSELSAISADLGSITAGDIVLPSGGFIRSGQTAYDTGTGFYLGNDSGTPKFSIGNASGNKLTWDGSALGVTGTIDIANATQTFTPSSWLGFSSDPSGDISYLDLGNVVFMWRDTALTGTSDDTFMVLNGVPIAIRPSAGRVAKCFVEIGTDVIDGSATISSGGVITFGASDTSTLSGRVIYSANFPNTGSKGLPAGWFIAYSR